MTLEHDTLKFAHTHEAGTSDHQNTSRLIRIDATQSDLEFAVQISKIPFT